MQPAVFVGQRGEQVEAAPGKFMVLERVGIGEGFEVQVADPQPLVAFRAVFVDGLHTLFQRGQARPVDLGDYGIRGRSQFFGRAARRRYGGKLHVGNGEIERRMGQHLDLYITEGHTAGQRDRRRRAHHGDHFVLQPCAAQTARIGIEWGIQFGGHLGERQAEPQRSVGVGVQFADREREVAGKMFPEIDGHLFQRLERLVVQRFHAVGLDHLPALEGVRILFAADEALRFFDGFG